MPRHFHQKLRVIDIVGCVLLAIGVGLALDLSIGDPLHFFSEKGIPSLFDTPPQ